MRKYFKIWAGLGIIPVLIISCATTTKLTNLSPAYLYFTPSTSSFRDPDAQLERYKTFSLFPLSLISKESKMNPILERQLLFYIRNLLEAKGYEFVQLGQNPDFLVTLWADIKYQESYVPPSSITLPHWVPGKTITTYGSSSGSFKLNTFGDYSSYGWGTWSSSDTKTTYIPGYMTTRTYTRPGYTVGHFYPTAVIQVYDGKTLRNVWMGSGAGTSDNADIRISGQFVLAHILKDYPNCLSLGIKDNIKSGMIGIQYGIFTNDGNSYFPTVINLREGAPAKKEGLEVHDMIIEVNGVSTLNKSFSEVLSLFRGEPGSEVNVKVMRLNEILNFTIRRTTWSGQIK
jgi:hypothetical protein